MAFNNRFTFVGTVNVPKADGKMKFVEETKSKDGKWSLCKMRFGMAVDKSNSQFAEIFAGYKADGKGIVYSFSKNDGETKGSKLEIPWKDRHSEKIVDMVADFKKLKVNLGEEMVFIHEYDMIKYLEQELPNHKDKLIFIAGDFKSEVVGDKTYNKFHPTMIKLANEDAKPFFKVSLDLYFNENSVSTDRFDEEKIVDVSAYISQYQNKEVGNAFVPINVVINASKGDFTDPRVPARIEYMKKMLTPTDGNFHHIPWEINVFRGAEEVDFTEDMLTDSQREQVELGISKIEDFRPKNNPLGTNKNEFRLSKAILSGDFADGVVDTGLDEEAFMAKLYKKVETKTAQEVKKETGVDLFGDDDADDLF